MQTKVLGGLIAMLLLMGSVALNAANAQDPFATSSRGTVQVSSNAARSSLPFYRQSSAPAVTRPAPSSVVPLGVPATPPPAVGGNTTVLANAEDGMFLRLDGILGDAANPAHANEIQLESYSWSVGRESTAARNTVEEFTLLMLPNRATPELFIRTMNAEVIPQAVLTIRSSARGRQEVTRWTLSDATIMSFKTGAEAREDGQLLDAITLRFNRVEVEFLAALPDGTAGATVRTGWDLRTGRIL